jgi:hypothetical protein
MQIATCVEAALAMNTLGFAIKVIVQGWKAGAMEEQCEHETFGGAKRDRTADLLVANEALSQLSYSPTRWEPNPILTVNKANADN